MSLSSISSFPLSDRLAVMDRVEQMLAQQPAPPTPAAINRFKLELIRGYVTQGVTISKTMVDQAVAAHFGLPTPLSIPSSSTTALTLPTKLPWERPSTIEDWQERQQQAVRTQAAHEAQQVRQKVQRSRTSWRISWGVGCLGYLGAAPLIWLGSHSLPESLILSVWPGVVCAGLSYALLASGWGDKQKEEETICTITDEDPILWEAFGPDVERLRRWSGVPLLRRYLAILHLGQVPLLNRDAVELQKLYEKWSDEQMLLRAERHKEVLRQKALAHQQAWAQELQNIVRAELRTLEGSLLPAVGPPSP